MTEKPTRVGIISANWGARAHLPAWRSLDDVEVVAICTSRPETAERAAVEHGIARAFHDFHAMAADPDIDLIDCGTRPPLRTDMVVSALAGGKHVYTGIPFAVDLEGARTQAAALEASCRTGAVDAFIGALPQILHLGEIIEAGIIGDVHGVRARLDLPLFFADRVNVPGYTWFADPANGTSVMRNMGSHLLHACVGLFGPIEAVVAQEAMHHKTWTMPGGATIEPRVADRACGLLRFRSGLLGEFALSWSMPGAAGFQFDVWGSHGRLTVSAPAFPQSADTRLTFAPVGPLGQPAPEDIRVPERLRRVDRSTADPDSTAAGVFPMARIFRSMLDEVAGRGSARPNFRQALHVEEVLAAAALSTVAGRWAAISEV